METISTHNISYYCNTLLNFLIYVVFKKNFPLRNIHCSSRCQLEENKFVVMLVWDINQMFGAIRLSGVVQESIGEIARALVRGCKWVGNG